MTSRAAAALALLATVAAAQGLVDLRVGYLERPRGAKEMAEPRLGDALKSLVAQATDLTPAAAKGELPLAKLDLLVIGSRFTDPDDAATAALVRKQAALRAFVAGGGTLVVFSQSHARNALPETLIPEAKAPEARRPWAFLEPDLVLEWSAQHFDAVLDVDASHPALAAPTRFDAERVNAWTGGGPVAVDAPLGAPGMRVLLGRRYVLGYPWLFEASAGKGRVFGCAGAIDRTTEDASDDDRALCRDLLAGIGSWVATWRGKPAPPFAPTFRTLPETTREAVLAFDDHAAFEARVAAAVDRGVAALLKMQKEDGSFGPFTANWGPKTYDVGQTCLAIMALLASGVSKHEPAIRRALAWLPTTPPRDTYQAGLHCLALEHKAAPDGERFELARLTLAERAKFVYKRFLDDGERKAIEGAAAWLTEARHRGFWRYLDDPKDADLSASQYAVLGLHAAQRCGATVPKEIFERVIDGLMSTQARGKDRVYHFPRRAAGGAAAKGLPEFEATTRGVGFWNYDAPVKATWGRGTPDCIGIALLALSLDALSRDGLKDHRAPKIAGAIDLALNHLDATWRVDLQPCDPGKPIDKWPDFYFLYTLERAMALTETRYVGRHDWYRETAEILCDLQRRDGRWDVAGAQWRSEVIHTSFALLTLKRATAPGRVTPR
ncbi:MAG TPA: hypothetical protein VEI02_16885 [Planctomycetota bacterium]|nr:hypothetical protein [Planctomycetota bacterium]